MIKILNLTKKFNDYSLFEIDNLELPSKGLVVIKGENGCGKTTLFNILSLIDNDYSGEILLDGKSYKKESDKVKSDFRKDEISYIFQKQNFISFLSIEENQNIYYELNEDKSKRNINISNETNATKVYKLSQGQQEKRRLDSGLAIGKNIYLLDEVLSSLDLNSREIYIKKIIELSKKALVLVVSHDVDIEKYANEVYEFNNHKLTCIKKENKKSHFEKENHTYKLKTHKIFLNYSLSIFFVLLLNTILSSMFFTLTYFGAFANKNDSFICLKQAFEEEGYLIFDPQNDVTSSYLLKKFNGSCFKAYNTTIPVGTIDGDGKNDTVYCTTKTFEKYAKVDKLIAKKKLIPKYSSLSYTIEIDDTLKDGIFFQKENSSVIDDYQFYKRFNYAFYDTDEFTKDELKNKYGEITIVSESFYKRSNSLNYKLDDDTFYVSSRKLLSSKIVFEFMTPYYYSKNDNYEPNLNNLFPNGIKTKTLDKLDENPIIPHIVVSDNTAKKFLTDHDSLILIKDKKYLMNAFYLYNKNYIVQNCNYFDTDLVLQKYKDFAQNKINVSLFTYSIMLYFFFIFNLFLEYIIYFNIVSKNQHNFFLLYAYGMEKKQIFIHSIIPLIISLMLSSLIGGLIALTQTKGFTFFISGIPLFVLFILLFVLISILIFKKGIKKHE